MYDGTLSILSNNHILARSGLAVVGEADIQPGLLDLRCVAADGTVVGNFPGDIVPLATANVDAALSTANANVDSSGEIMDIGIPCSETQVPVVGLNVVKSGRTTGQTWGTVQATNVSVTMRDRSIPGSTGRPEASLPLLFQTPDSMYVRFPCDAPMEQRQFSFSRASCHPHQINAPGQFAAYFAHY